MLESDPETCRITAGGLEFLPGTTQDFEATTEDNGNSANMTAIVTASEDGNTYTISFAGDATASDGTGTAMIYPLLVLEINGTKSQDIELRWDFQGEVQASGPDKYESHAFMSLGSNLYTACGELIESTSLGIFSLHITDYYGTTLDDTTASGNHIVTIEPGNNHLMERL